MAVASDGYARKKQVGVQDAIRDLMSLYATVTTSVDGENETYMLHALRGSAAKPDSGGELLYIDLEYSTVVRKYRRTAATRAENPSVDVAGRTWLIWLAGLIPRLAMNIGIA